LNYIQIEDLIAFIRAPSTQEFIVRDPELLEPELDPITKEVKTFNGWVDESYKPAPGATPFPACWATEFAASPGPSGSPSASVDPNAAVVEIAASGIKFEPTEITAPADEPFVIDFANQDASTPHNIEIKDSTGAVKFTGPTFNGVETRQYQVPPLAAGTYPFVCTVHPGMEGTLTVE
jgi:plastocyanin